MRQVEGPWKGAVSAQKALRGSVMETRELLGGTEENCVSLTIWLSDPPQYMIAWALPVLKLLFCSVPGYTTVSKSTCVRHTHSSVEAAEMTTLQEISYFHLKDTMQLGQSQLSSPLSQVKLWPFLGGCCVQGTKVFFLLSAKMCFLGCHNNNTTLHVSWIIQTTWSSCQS